ncbi:protein BUNDLE SHEATH DEFECTIVE 2, chloroplastic-like [Diospyros lotus]|uniref:protein BUNDLE SHEATH DEFECTIVE 2, chloroplastic-like n=1 Tax=Diospyros lotus TaxID=55363 RepID=UPI0022512A45|nr:protein BUNDLE SHEATH DEFECTIVE 2, chloroplastic-like [Diospyros lotus]
MATSSPCFSLLNSLTVIQKPGDNSRCSCGMNSSNQKPQRTVKCRPVKAKATKDDQGTVRKSVICSDCDGNGAVLCSQCKGSGVNHVDYFDGQFKAGESCWLCGGKKDMLCGNCNGAGFLGGFMNSFDT